MRLKTFSKTLDFENKASYLTFVFASFQILFKPLLESNILKIEIWIYFPNHSSQKYQYNGMYAQTCCYPYVGF